MRSGLVSLSIAISITLMTELFTCPTSLYAQWSIGCGAWAQTGRLVGNATMQTLGDKKLTTFSSTPQERLSLAPNLFVQRELIDDILLRLDVEYRPTVRYTATSDKGPMPSLVHLPDGSDTIIEFTDRYTFTSTLQTLTTRLSVLARLVDNVYASAGIGDIHVVSLDQYVDVDNGLDGAFYRNERLPFITKPDVANDLVTLNLGLMYKFELGKNLDLMAGLRFERSVSKIKPNNVPSYTVYYDFGFPYTYTLNPCSFSVQSFAAGVELQYHL